MEQFTEHCKISLKYEISRQILDKLLVQSVKKSCLVHKFYNSVSGCPHENS